MRSVKVHIGVLLVAWALAPTASSMAHTVCPGDSTVQGLDVDRWQGDVDWAQVAGSGVGFAIARFADGLTVDPSFADNYAGIRAAGMIRGAYQILQPGQDPLAQSDLLLAGIGSLAPGDLPPALWVILEDGQSPSQMGQCIQAWSSAVHAATGRIPFIYTGTNFWNHSVDSPASADNPLAIADWAHSCPNIPDMWSSWVFWQYTSTGSIPGVTGSVKRDLFNGSVAELQALAGMVPSSVPPGTWFSLSSYPNPFNPRTTIRFDLPDDGPVRVAVYDVAGRLIRTLVDERRSQGSHAAVWDGRDGSGRNVPSGSYLARLEFDGKTESVRMGLIR